MREEGTGELDDDNKEITRQVVHRPGQAGCEPLKMDDRVIYIDSNVGGKARNGNAA